MDTHSCCRFVSNFVEKGAAGSGKILVCSALLVLSSAGTVRGQLSDSQSVFWFQEDSGLVSECLDAAGSSLAIGDFDGNGLGDLAIGIPEEDVGDLADAGIVAISYGAPGGWDQRTSQWWWQGTPGVAGLGEAGDYFGNALAVGDFNCDGFDDLAIGSHLEDIGDTANAGAVIVLFGSSGGLTATGSQAWSQDSSGVVGLSEESDQFGGALASGDFNADGCGDLAI